MISRARRRRRTPVRLLARDRARFRALSLHEMILPAVTAQRAIRWAARLDARTGGRLARRIERARERVLGPLDDLHRLRLGEIEEDEFVLWAIFASDT